MKNKVITSQGNVQFIFPDGKVVNVHPNHIYTAFNEDTVSFILVALPKSSGLALMTSKAEDLELNGETYSFAELPAAMSEAFAIAGAQARCEIVDELPETGYTNTIYLVPQPSPQTGFDEYVYVDGEWELIGDTSIEMENYVTKTVFNGYTASTAAELSGKAEVVEITQANYDLLPSSAKTDASKLYVISDALPIDLSVYAKASALTEEISARTDADTALDNKINAVSAATDTALSAKQDQLIAGENITISGNVISSEGGGGEVSSAITSGDTNAVAGGAVFDAVVYSGNTYTTELTFDADGYAENWVVGQSAITIDVSGYTSNTSADYRFENSDGRGLGNATINKTIDFWGGNWNNNGNNCTITTDGDTATTAIITDIPSGTVKLRRTSESNPPKAIISGDTPETWIKDALDDHRDNTTVHITAAERTSWNNKSNFSGSYNDLTDKPIPDSALNVASTNPVQNQALYSELRLSDGGETETTLVFDGYSATNYPQGCTKIKVEGITSMSQNSIYFFADGGVVGNITVSNWGSISVDTSNFQGASYEISGSSVIISYPTVTTVTRLDVSDSTKYTYKAITSSTTPLKDQVEANTTALGGLTIVKITESEYAALVTKDESTLYVVIPDPTNP